MGSHSARGKETAIAAIVDAGKVSNTSNNIKGEGTGAIGETTDIA
jgi:hypothetical protein